MQFDLWRSFYPYKIVDLTSRIGSRIASTQKSACRIVFENSSGTTRYGAYDIIWYEIPAQNIYFCFFKISCQVDMITLSTFCDNIVNPTGQTLLSSNHMIHMGQGPFGPLKWAISYETYQKLRKFRWIESR